MKNIKLIVKTKNKTYPIYFGNKILKKFLKVLPKEKNQIFQILKDQIIRSKMVQY